MHRFALLLALAVALGVPGSAVASGDSPPYCQGGAAISFQFGFLQLRQQLGDVMGETVECDHFDPVSGDRIQHTTTGLAFQRQRGGAMIFTNGGTHWTVAPGPRVVTWQGDSADPPAELLVPPAPTTEDVLYHPAFPLPGQVVLGDAPRLPPPNGSAVIYFEDLQAITNSATNIEVDLDQGVRYALESGHFNALAATLREAVPALQQLETLLDSIAPPPAFTDQQALEAQALVEHETALGILQDQVDASRTDQIVEAYQHLVNGTAMMASATNAYPLPCYPQR
jgi:hypothetical protein